MARGDQRSRKGKISAGSHGKTRPHKNNKKRALAKAAKA